MGCDDSYPSRYIVIPSHILSGPIQDALFSLRLQRSLRMTFSQSFTCLRGYPMRAALLTLLSSFNSVLSKSSTGETT
jgi:hypothetical protein